MLDLSEVFEDLTIEIGVKRFNDGYRDGNGFWVDGGFTIGNIKAVVQTANEQDKQVLEEGIRQNEAIKIHTIEQLKCDDDLSVKQSDIVVYNGKEYEIKKLFDLLNTNGNYSKAIATRIL